MIAGKYRLERLLKQGGMGAVWIATHLGLDERVAVKFMDPRRVSSAEARIRFTREAKAAAQIRSKNIVQILDHGVDNHVPYIAMELLGGEDLAARLRRVGRLSVVETSALLGDIAHALDRAHAAGIVHRDLKPENIFLAKDGDHEIPKILDFGIALEVQADASDDSAATQEGVILGTPYFMSPEQVRGRANVDHRSDIWSLGVIVFRAITGIRPFGRGAPADVIVQICSDPIPRASVVARDLPEEVDRFFEKALARDVARRFSSAKEMAAAFAAIARLAGAAEKTAAEGAGAAVEHPERTSDPRSAGAGDRTSDMRLVGDRTSDMRLTGDRTSETRVAGDRTSDTRRMRLGRGSDRGNTPGQSERGTGRRDASAGDAGGRGAEEQAAGERGAGARATRPSAVASPLTSGVGYEVSKTLPAPGMEARGESEARGDATENGASSAPERPAGERGLPEAAGVANAAGAGGDGAGDAVVAAQSAAASLDGAAPTSKGPGTPSAPGTPATGTVVSAAATPVPGATLTPTPSAGASALMTPTPGVTATPAPVVELSGVPPSVSAVAPSGPSGERRSRGVWIALAGAAAAAALIGVVFREKLFAPPVPAKQPAGATTIVLTAGTVVLVGPAGERLPVTAGSQTAPQATVAPTASGEPAPSAASTAAAVATPAATGSEPAAAGSAGSVGVEPAASATSAGAQPAGKGTKAPALKVDSSPTTEPIAATEPKPAEPKPPAPQPKPTAAPAPTSTGDRDLGY